MSPHPKGSEVPCMNFSAKFSQPPSLMMLLHYEDLENPSRHATTAGMIGGHEHRQEQGQLRAMLRSARSNETVLLSPTTQYQQHQQQIPTDTPVLTPSKPGTGSEKRHDWRKQSARVSIKKQRRPSHVIKQEAKRELCDQISHLECQVALLRQEKGIADPRTNDGVLESNAKLCEAVLHQRLILANTQSAFSAFVTSQATSPLESYIHLGGDWELRRQVLLNMKDAKLDVARRFLAERTRHLSPFKKFYEVSQSESADGDICIVKMDVTPFENVTSVRQVYDALQEYFLTSDATIVELPGSISVRDDDDEDDVNAKKAVLHHRLVTFEQSGILSEKNSVLFLDQSGLGAAKAEDQCALFTGDFVNRDDLYPYCPSHRVRKDAASVMRLSAHWRRRYPETQGSQVILGSEPREAQSDPRNELVVVLTRWAHLRVRRPEIPVSRRVLQYVADDLLKGVDKMIHVTKEKVGEE